MPKQVQNKKKPTPLFNSDNVDHVNAFLDLDGVPYLLGEYLDKNQFRQIDRSIIRNDIFVDQNEAMRAIVDINIDDIGRRADGYPNIIGNRTKYRNLIKMILHNADRLQYRLDVVKRGIIVRINYRLENQRTNAIIRSTSEDLRINNRNYFLDINPRDINDNALITNFSDSIISTINQFTHGIDPMIIRITSVQLFYEVMKRDERRRSVSDPYLGDFDDLLPDLAYDNDFYYHHRRNQKKHSIGFDENRDESINPIYPPSWLMFNRYYHFDDNGRDIDLHFQEINDIKNRIYLIPCGTVHVNRMFRINPGHQIVFKISVWKNDVTSITNSQKIAQALGAQCLSPGYCHTHTPKPPINIDMETVIRLLMERERADRRQNYILDKFVKVFKQLVDKQIIEDDESIEPGDDGDDIDDIDNGQEPIEEPDENQLP